MCFFDRERPTFERHRIAIEEVLGLVRWNVGVERKLGICGTVDASQVYFAIPVISKEAALDADSEGGHGDNKQGILSKLPASSEAYAVHVQ